MAEREIPTGSNNFPSNSHKTREEREKPKKPQKQQKVIKHKVVTRKKGLFKKFSESYLGEGITAIASYVFNEILVPAGKNTLSEMLHSSTDMMIYKEDRSARGRRGDRRPGYVSYDGFYRDDRREGSRTTSLRNRTRHNFDDIIIETRAEADEVIGRLVDLIDNYGEAAVSDLYDLVGIESNHADTKYGWVNLNSARPLRVRDGYLLDLPRTILLD